MQKSGLLLKIKTAILIGGLFCTFGTAHAKILSASGNTAATIRSACVATDDFEVCSSCLLDSSGSVNSGRTFDTDTHECSDTYGYRYFYKYEDCYNNLSSSGDDACYACMFDPSISTIDGDGFGIRFEVFRDEEFFLCYVNEDQYVKCADGYYGYPDSNDWDTLGGCYPCPSPGVISTSYGTATSITDCYIPKNTTVSETSGKYVYSSNCNYSN